MEKKTMDTLRVMLCGELDEVAKQGSLTHESLDIMKDLLESIKNLEKIEKLQKEKESSEMMGYSQRSMGRYYVDGSYGNGNSYAPNQYTMMDGNSYARGNSYYGYDPMYDYSMPFERARYSRNNGKQEIIDKLHEMKNEATDEKVKSALSEAIDRMSR